MMRALWIALLAAPALAAPPVSCPLTLPQEAVEVKAPAGWRGHSSSFVRLTGYGMMAGPPESMTYLVPHRTRNLKNGAATTWVFAPEDEKWLYCTYDGSSAIQISRRMDEASTECELSYKKSKFGGIGEMTAVCR
jgi:hypothetical protein